MRIQAAIFLLFFLAMPVLAFGRVSWFALLFVAWVAGCAVYYLAPLVFKSKESHRATGR